MLKISCLLSNALRLTRAETQDGTGMEQVQPVFKLTNLIGQFDWSHRASVFRCVRLSVFSLSLSYSLTELGQLPPEAIYVCICRDWNKIFDWFIFLFAAVIHSMNEA